MFRHFKFPCRILSVISMDHLRKIDLMHMGMFYMCKENKRRSNTSKGDNIYEVHSRVFSILSKCDLVSQLI